MASVSTVVVVVVVELSTNDHARPISAHGHGVEGPALVASRFVVYRRRPVASHRFPRTISGDNSPNRTIANAAASVTAIFVSKPRTTPPTPKGDD